MIKRTGIHLYVNISNLNDIIEAEEKVHGELNHSLHAMDTFFTSIEMYGKKHYRDVFTVEKITGSRLHMFITSKDVKMAFNVVKTISVFAFKLTSIMVNDIGKYKNLMKFNVQIGADYGPFYEYVFQGEGIEEMTTIGYTANFAAKLQALARNSQISISESIYKELCAIDAKDFEKISTKEIEKYDQNCYYVADLSALKIKYMLQKDFERAKQYANKVNLTQMKSVDVHQRMNFDNVSNSKYKKMNGVPLFADVRGFTELFEADDSNLEEMKNKTTSILNDMYRAITSQKGIHVQFQGDREMALFHDFPKYECAKDAVIAGLRIIDVVKKYSVSVGIGQSIGTIYAAKVGARGEKDNILLGSTVNDADYYEDSMANENQLVISNDIYSIIKKSEPGLAAMFTKKNDQCYFTEKGYTRFKLDCEKRQQIASTKTKSYNGAWGKCFE